MPSTPATANLPRRLLLATDLSCRCDRALDRAVALCRQWQAELVVVHALESQRAIVPREQISAEARIAEVEGRLKRDLAGAFLQPTIVVEPGDPAELVLRSVAEQGCDLIVAGIARDEIFGRIALGNTVDALLRAAPVPLLVVKDRPHGAYERVLVATDFSGDAQAALAMAVRIAPNGLTLFHAFDAPFSGWTGRTQYLADAQAAALERSAAFLAEAPIPEAAKASIVSIAENGTLGPLLQAHVASQQVDLVVLGLPQRGFVVETLIGSRARAVLDEVHCDLLLVRAAAAST
ncbi:universal stress protein [Bosea sp. TWI1241]|uniref:universal stress protein n=1 Tax=Bosea sp. TWI1241 TaxID=3148904 RepID=UPI003208076C